MGYRRKLRLQGDQNIRDAQIRSPGDPLRPGLRDLLLTARINSRSRLINHRVDSFFTGQINGIQPARNTASTTTLRTHSINTLLRRLLESRAGMEGHAVLTNLHLIASSQNPLINPGAVDVSAVQ